MAFRKHGLCGQDTSQGKREPTFLPKLSEPTELYHSSGKIISPRATLTSPIPRLLTLSAVNFCRAKTF